MSTIPSSAVRSYLATQGRKGGKTKGKAKRRGTSDHYRALAETRWRKRGHEETLSHLTTHERKIHLLTELRREV